MNGRRHFLLSVSDSLIALSTAVGVVILSNRGHLPHASVRLFLAQRVTLVNAAFSVVFAVLWSKCFDWLTMYRGSFRRPLAALTRAGWNCLLMTLVLMCYMVARGAYEPLEWIGPRFLAITFLYEAVRIALMNSPVFGSQKRRAIIVGSGRRASKAWRELRLNRGYECEFVGFVDNRDPAEMAPDIKARYLTDVHQLADYLLRNVVDEMVIALPMRSCYEMAQLATAIGESAGLRVLYMRDIYTLSHSTVLRRRADPFIEMVPHDELQRARQALKRVIDVALSSAGLICLAPLFIVVALAVKLTSRGPVFFVQDRYGYRRRRFPMYKFRSMVHNAPELMAKLEAHNEAQGPIFKIKNDPRITKVGKFLRQSSLDELPQLWNVLRGDMSLVGPRPMSVRDVSLFNEAALMRRFSVRPGITGMWQVSGRSRLTFEQWVALDFKYIEDWSLELDFKIMAQTVPAVLKRSGAA